MNAARPTTYETNRVADANNYFLGVAWYAIYDDEPGPEAIEQRLLETRFRLHQFFHQQVNVLRRPIIFATVQIQHLDNVALLRQRMDWGVGARYRTPAQFLQYFMEDATTALQNLATSGDGLFYEDLEFEIALVTNPQVYAGAGPLKTRQRAINSQSLEAGIYTDMSARLPNLCGWAALVEQLIRSAAVREAWQGDLTWLQTNGCYDPKCLRSKSRLLDFIDSVRQHLNCPEDLWQLSPALNAPSTAQRIVQAQPKLQIVIYNYTNKALYCRAVGEQWQWNQNETATVYMCLQLDYTKRQAVGHLRLIKSPLLFYGWPQLRPGYFFCAKCLVRHSCTHACDGKSFACDKCGTNHLTAEELTLHKSGSSKNGDECERCGVEFYSEFCMQLHQCRFKYAAQCLHCHRYILGPHHCQDYACRHCQEDVKLDEMHEHVCYMSKPPHCELLEEQDEIEAKQLQHYAFDVESAFEYNVETKLNRHVVNFVHVQRCFTTLHWSFATVGEFLNWCMKLDEPSKMFAHNLKGYDGRLIYEQLVALDVVLDSALWRGSKLLNLKVGHVEFCDTLLHLPASLEQLPKMFSMDPTQFKKGFFPYMFNTAANQDYVGPLPDKHYFQPEMMKVEKLKEFDQWWQDNRVVEYKFREELEAYCRSDVSILRLAIERYMETQMSRHPINPWDSMTIASYALKVYRQFYMPPRTIGILNQVESMRILPSLHGGRTDVRCLLREWTPQEVAAGYYGKYQDVQSLYPTVQFYDPMPVGKPNITEYAAEAQPPPDWHVGFYGFVECDIHCTRYLHHPVIVDYDADAGLLLSDLLPKRKIMIPSPELHLALANGYVVTRVHCLIRFNSSCDLFKDYFRKFLKLKIQAAGVPKWVGTDEGKWREFVDYHRTELGIELHRDDMVPNSSLKTCAKLLCNSLWGKFAETAKPSTYKMYKMDEDFTKWAAFQKQWIEGELTVQYHRRSPNGVNLSVISRQVGHNLGYSRLRRINVALASMVTSHARCRLWTEMNKLGDRVLYHDTDSIIYERDPAGYNIPEGRYLGEWEDECDGLPMIRFASTGPKSYSYALQKRDGTLKSECKVKGITLTSHNAQLVNFESMKRLVNKEVQCIETTSLLFKYERGSGQRAGQMYTGIQSRDFRVTYAKGLIDPLTYRIYPFGAGEFRPDLTTSLSLWAAGVESPPEDQAP